jgi:hypothetical protein
MAEINIELRGIPEVTQRLQSTPGAVRWALAQSILRALTKSKSAAVGFARERYLAPVRDLRAAIGTPRLSGLSGFLRISGAKLPLSMFPWRAIAGGGGVEVQELRNSPAMVFRHAFNERIFERKTKEVKRFPIVKMFASSVPAMIGERKEVFPKLKEKLDTDVHAELDRLVRLILSGAVKPR